MTKIITESENEQSINKKARQSRPNDLILTPVNRFRFASSEDNVSVSPDLDMAIEYIEARNIREFYFCGGRYQLHRKYTKKEREQFAKKEKELEKLHPDIRNQIFVGSKGKVGLRNVLGEQIIPAEFDAIPERYDYYDWMYLIPIVKDGFYYLYNHKRNKIVSNGYECIFRYNSNSGTKVPFVAMIGEKKGLLSGLNGKEIVPIDMDEIFEMQDPHGFIPLLIDGKWGAYKRSIYVEPIYNKLKIEPEEHTKFWLNGKCGWLDFRGVFTQDKTKAYF